MSSLEEMLTEAKQFLIVQEQTSSSMKREHRIVQLAWLCFLAWQPSDSIQQTVRTHLLNHCDIDGAILDDSADQPYHRLVSQLKLLEKEHPGTIYSFYGGLLELLNEDTRQEKSKAKKQEKSRAKKHHAFFHTPLALAHFMIDILNPQPEETIYDPASGSCGLLIEAARKAQTPAQPLLGCEQDPNALALGVIQMALHNLDISGIQCRDALIQPQLDLFHQEQQTISGVQVLLTHPSFGRYEGQSRDEQRRGVPPYYESRILRHSMDILDQRGRCAIIISLNALSNANQGHVPLRRSLFHAYTIQMIIGLPPRTFGERSNYWTFLLVFTAGGKTQQTLCYNLPRQQGPVCTNDFEPIRVIWPEWLVYLEKQADKVDSLVPSLPEGAWIEKYEDIFQDLEIEEGQETQMEKPKNSYDLVPTPPTDHVQLESPHVLAEQIAQNANELKRCAQKLQAMLAQKELDA